MAKNRKIKIKRALVSVSDKTGIVDLAKKLHNLNIEIISTGGTEKLLRKNMNDLSSPFASRDAQNNIINNQSDLSIKIKSTKEDLDFSIVEFNKIEKEYEIEANSFAASLAKKNNLETKEYGINIRCFEDRITNNRIYANNIISEYIAISITDCGQYYIENNISQIIFYDVR